jgi:putative transposase
VSRFRWIRVEQATFPVSVLCRVLRVSRAGFYAWARRGPSARDQQDEALTEQIREVHARSRRTYGSPRTQATLAAGGRKVGRKRVARLMRAAGLRGRTRRRTQPRTTVVDPVAIPATNVVRRQFGRRLLNQLWVGDITYIRTAEGWLYLAILLDACSRRVVGWAMADHLRTELVLEALRMAVGQRRPLAGELIHHTDRGCQYTSHAYQEALASQVIGCSMSRAGNCFDNALAESFFATLKNELVEREEWATQEAARRAIFEWIAVFYNRQRRHSGLGYRSPVDFELTLPHNMQAA